MKKILMTAAAMAVSTVAQAGSVNLDFRADYNSTTYNDEAKAVNTALENSARFYLKTGRIDYKGTLNEEVSYRARLAFTKNATVASKDATQTAVELAYMTQKFNDTFSLSLGKFNSEIGGFETATSGADLYLTSENYTRSTLARAGSTTTTNLAVLYMTGAKATFSFAGQDIHVIATDNLTDATNTATGPSVQNRGLLGISWRGNFLDKTIGVVANYYEASPQSTPTTTIAGDSKQSFITAGVKYELSPVMAYVEYHLSTFKDGATDDEDKLSSIVAKFAYTGWEQWIPRVEFFSSEDKRVATTDKYMGYGLVLEYIPKKADTFRYHVAANMIDEDREGSDNLTKTEFIVGTRLMADFLK